MNSPFSASVFHGQELEPRVDRQPRSGSNFQANLCCAKSLRNREIPLQRVYAATQGRGLVYTRSHLVHGLSSKSLIRRKIGSNSLWHSNCDTKWESGSGSPAISHGNTNESKIDHHPPYGFRYRLHMHLLRRQSGQGHGGVVTHANYYDRDRSILGP